MTALTGSVDPTEFMLLTAGYTYLIILVASLALPIVVMLFLPGRRGWMRTERRAIHPNMTAEAAWDIYAARLQFDGFEVDPIGRPVMLRATRPKRSPIGTIGGVHAQSNKPLGAEGQFTPAGTGVSVMIAVWAKDLVLCDTGEGEYINRTLDRIMTADLANEPRPVVCAPSFSPVKALVVAAAVWIGIGGLLHSGLQGDRAKGIALGLALGVVLGTFSAIHGLWEIRSKPDELHGTGRAIAALAALVLAMAVVATIFLRAG